MLVVCTLYGLSAVFSFALSPVGSLQLCHVVPMYMALLGRVGMVYSSAVHSSSFHTVDMIP